MNVVLEILSPGLGACLQDLGLQGWRRFGVPPGGAMDDLAARYANRLLGNPDSAPVLELLLQGTRLKLVQDTWMAITGADSSVNAEPWRAIQLTAGTVLEWPRNRSGLWTYVAVAGGFALEGPDPAGPGFPRGPLGQALQPGDSLSVVGKSAPPFPDSISGRRVAPEEQRHYLAPPTLRVWPGPQWDSFEADVRRQFFEESWTVTSQSNRVGYRLSGKALRCLQPHIVSEPVLMGSIQVPDNGQPIVTMRDGPTVGGYPKIGVIDPADLAWLAQCRPGQSITFRPVETDL